mgnify:CR=1
MFSWILKLVATAKLKSRVQNIKRAERARTDLLILVRRALLSAMQRDTQKNEIGESCSCKRICKPMLEKSRIALRQKNGVSLIRFGGRRTSFLGTHCGEELSTNPHALFAGTMPKRTIQTMTGRLMLCGYARGTTKKHTHLVANNP